MISKKAISGVIVAILLVLVAVVAVTIFWFALKPSIERSAEGLGKGEECLILSLKIDSLSTSQIKVSRTGRASLTGIKILVNGLQKSLVADVPRELETKTYPLTPALASGDKVEIAGVLEDDVICNIADSDIVG